MQSKTSTDHSFPPDTRKQKMAMPPNFIHSLDSTHMMLTALYCERYYLEHLSLIYSVGLTILCRLRHNIIHTDTNGSQWQVIASLLQPQKLIPSCSCYGKLRS